MSKSKELADLIWRIAERLRGPYKRAEYGSVILPFTVLRRLDCVLESTRADVIAARSSLGNDPKQFLKEATLKKAAQANFYNEHPHSLSEMLGNPNHILRDLNRYCSSFSPNISDIFRRFEFDKVLAKLEKKKLLYSVFQEIVNVDLSPEKFKNTDMGAAYEELIRRFKEASNEAAGEYFTPREVIELMSHIIFTLPAEDTRLARPGLITTIYDPACGTGGMLTVAEDYLEMQNSSAVVKLFGQEIHEESYAICKADLIIKGHEVSQLVQGDSFEEDGHNERQFDFMLCNPPFGVEWKDYEKYIRDEHAQRGHDGRFGAGLPRINDGSLLFLQHMISKMKPAVDGDPTSGTRIAVVFNGSPLFTGAAGSGESEIRRWIIERDWLDAIIALPDQLFYNTGISTYIWVLTNNKEPKRRGKVQLIDGRNLFVKMPRSVGNKRNLLSPEQISELTDLYANYQEGPRCKVFPKSHFGYTRVTIERPLRLSFQISAERIERLAEGWAEQVEKLRAKKKLPADLEARQEALLAALRGLVSDQEWKNREAFVKHLKKALRELRLATPELKAILGALGERDETADICTDAKGNPEPDPELRDAENVPLNEDIDAYVTREVKPYAPDAWVKDDGGKIGYEIGLTREFYQYVPPRPVDDLEAELAALTLSLEENLKALGAWKA